MNYNINKILTHLIENELNNLIYLSHYSIMNNYDLIYSYYSDLNDLINKHNDKKISIHDIEVFCNKSPDYSFEKQCSEFKQSIYMTDIDNAINILTKNFLKNDDIFYLTNFNAFYEQFKKILLLGLYISKHSYNSAIELYDNYDNSLKMLFDEFFQINLYNVINKDIELANNESKILSDNILKTSHSFKNKKL